MNALTRHESAALPQIRVSEEELLKTLQDSIYPGAKIESIKMVLGYCKASQLDPLQKPVHLVPMSVATGKKNDKGWDIKETRDVVMPGIGLYRHNAAKTGQYVGMSEPTYGPTRTLAFQSTQWVEDDGRRKKISRDETMEYPEWCSVTVRRLVGGTVCEFPAREYWMENYATKGNDTAEPNAMWRKRPFGQLAKCAEAQALRKAFPGETGSQPTAEEMEGKTDFDDARTIDVPARAAPAAPVGYPADEFAKNLESWAKVVAAGRKTVEEIAAMAAAKGKGALTEAQVASLTSAAAAIKQPAAPKVTYAQVAQALHDAENQQQANDAATLIAAVADEQQRAELTSIYEQRIADLKE